MDVENIFRDVKLSKTEMTVLRFIQNDPEQCIRQGVRAVAEQCYSNPSSLVRLAKKLKFSGWLELVYFIKFNITMPKLDVTNDIDYMSVQMCIRDRPLYRPGVNVLLLRKTDKAVIRGEIPVICVPARQLTLCAAAIDLLSFSADPGRIWNNFNRRGDCLRLPCGEEHGCINDICPFAIGINRWLRRV